MDALFRELKIYAAQGQKYEPVDHDLLLSYTESNRRPDPRGGHHRGRLDGQLHRRRHELRHPRRADDAVLHVLFDVRLPARRRPHLAGGRHPRPRLPARRHRRAHHAARRGAPAPGRPQPRAGLDGAGRAGLRPGVRLRGRRHRPGRASSACTAPSRAETSATSSTTSRSTTRTTRCRPMPEGDADGSRPAIVEGLYRWPSAPEGPSKRATILFSGCAHGAARAAVGRARRALRRRRRAVVGDVATSGCARRPWRPSAGTGCTRRRSRRVPAASPSCSPTSQGPIIAVSPTS